MLDEWGAHYKTPSIFCKSEHFQNKKVKKEKNVLNATVDSGCLLGRPEFSSAQDGNQLVQNSGTLCHLFLINNKCLRGFREAVW